MLQWMKCLRPCPVTPPRTSLHPPGKTCASINAFGLNLMKVSCPLPCQTNGFLPRSASTARRSAVVALSLRTRMNQSHPVQGSLQLPQLHLIQGRSPHLLQGSNRALLQGSNHLTSHRCQTLTTTSILETIAPFLCPSQNRPLPFQSATAAAIETPPSASMILPLDARLSGPLATQERV